jgi:hypothetical protein
MTRFNPADYPAYTFDPVTGTPTRTATPKRGPLAGIPNREVRPAPRKPGGDEYFQIQRADGKYRHVSRTTIRLALNPWAETPQPEPATLPPWSFDIPGFAGYAVVLDPFSVIRYDSPASGPINPPNKLKISERRRDTLDRTYIYHTCCLVDENTGRRRHVQAEKIMELAGVTAADIAAAHARHLDARSPAPNPESSFQNPQP